MGNGLKFALLMAELMTVLSAVLVTFHPNVLYASVALLFTFLGIAAMFIFAGADFLAGAQVIIYVGGVTILILFAIMLTQWLYKMKLSDLRNKLLFPALVLAIGIAPWLFKALTELSKTVTANVPKDFATFSVSPKTEIIGDALLGNFLLPFEVVTILLLGALVGAVWIARPKT